MELYFLKYFVADTNTIFYLKTLENQPFGAPLKMILESTDQNMTRWANEIDMDVKENKLTYQKSRFIVIIALAVVEQIYELGKYVIFGSSDLDIVLKTDKSMSKFFMLIAIIIFK